MKKAEIIKNGNVNIKPIKLKKKIKKEVDWDDLELDYILWVNACVGINPSPRLCFHWLKNRLS